MKIDYASGKKRYTTVALTPERAAELGVDYGSNWGGSTSELPEAGPGYGAGLR